MKLRVMLLSLGLVAGVVLIGAGSKLLTRPYAFHGSLIDPPAAAADFALTDQTGAPFRLSEKKGLVILLFFGYTFCPDVCPATLAQFKQVRQALGPDAERVKFVLVTVDPERDSPERLQMFLKNFDPAFVGVTGAEAELAPVWQSYGVYREKRPVGEASAAPAAHSHSGVGEDYSIDHNSRIYAIDPRGKLRLTYLPDTPARDLAEDIRQLLQ